MLQHIYNIYIQYICIFFVIKAIQLTRANAWTIIISQSLNFVFALILIPRQFSLRMPLWKRPEPRAIMIISWSDNGTRSYSYELSRASRWETRAGRGCARHGADFTLEKSGNGAGKEELRSRRRLSFWQCKGAARWGRAGRESEKTRKRLCARRAERRRGRTRSRKGGEKVETWKRKRKSEIFRETEGDTRYGGGSSRIRNAVNRVAMAVGGKWQEGW